MTGSLLQFEEGILAASGDLVVAPAISVFDFSISPTDSHAVFQLGADGFVYRNIGSTGAGAAEEPWVTPQSRASAYEVRVTVTAGGPFTAGTVGSWLALSSDRLWRVSITGLGTLSVTFTIEIRRASDGVVVSTTTGNTMEATVEA